ncbi:hypothetical protein HDU98_002730 [Podochytrium sp. JEL0797]|nr:hypothetical protein HDU98_002730 [Podochytrium sp. JEL0797]
MSFFSPLSLLNAHSQSVTLGYSQRQLFAIIAGVQHYPQFVPWCAKSNILTSHTAKDPLSDRTVTRMRAELSVGFQAFNEQYTSNVTCIHMSSVNAVASDSSLFKTLTTTWTLSPALDKHIRVSNSSIDSNLSLASNLPMAVANHPRVLANSADTVPPASSTPRPNAILKPRKLSSADLVQISRGNESVMASFSPLPASTATTPTTTTIDNNNKIDTSREFPDEVDHPVCNVHFHIAFEFKSVLYAHVSDMFFNQVSLAMVKSFEDRARSVYGPPSQFH